MSRGLSRSSKELTLIKIKRIITTALLAASIFKPSDHEEVAESPTEIEQIQTDVSTENLPQPKTIDVVATQSIDVVVTHYTASCEGCIGITKNGTDVRNTIYSEGKRIIAVDPNVIPLNSTVQVTYEDGTTFKAIAADTGGAIKGARIDVLVASESEAYELGRKRAELTILNE